MDLDYGQYLPQQCFMVTAKITTLFNTYFDANIILDL